MEIIEIFKGTPLWVFLLFAYLIKKGIEAFKTRVVTLKKIFLLPAIFMVWSISSLNLSQIATWSAVFAAGILLGCLLNRNIKLKADKKQGLLSLPGEFTTLILLILVFAVKYFFGCLFAINPALREDALFKFCSFGSSGLITGLFMGKALSLLLKYQKAEHNDLQMDKTKSVRKST